MSVPGTTTAASAPAPAKKVIIIENPFINSPFEEPKQHFKFAEDGITDEIVNARRLSSYFVPIPHPKKKGKPLVFDTECTEDRIKENKWINELRARVAKWLLVGYQGAATVTKQLLAYWQCPERERRLFCQIEALETEIYIAEVASRFGDSRLITTSPSRTRPQIPCCTAWHSRWRRAAARPLSTSLWSRLPCQFLGDGRNKGAHSLLSRSS